MKPRPRSRFPVPAAACCLLLSAGLLATAACSLLPQAQSDPTRFYVLATAAAGAAGQAAAPAVHLREVELADYLRGRALIVRRGDNEIEFREFARWGEPLDLGIARVVREELLAGGAASTMRNPGSRREHVKYDYILSLRVVAAEGGPNGAVEFRAIWEIATGDSRAPLVAHGHFRARDLHWDGKTEASLAAQLSQAVAGLAREIAAALPKK